uniref:Biotin--protein ligase n=1 Tax=Tetraselmis sp. GSL018 TaxID=582737 RepID=A0A061S017_9CHLO|mmetsp:Transcript_31687/g.75266  ORF Transcript_31687/g.75266 Transcript_31687/m.75266 type:complete len:341 (+) Transcript_31687:269-1291(+)
MVCLNSFEHIVGRSRGKTSVSGTLVVPSKRAQPSYQQRQLSRLGRDTSRQLPPTKRSVMHGTALVYSGPGAGKGSLQNLVDSLRLSLEPELEVGVIGPRELLEGRWTAGCALLAVPGGADLPYCHELNGAGNAIIRGFVEAGGSYLGICAGAYYGSGFVEFEAGTRMEVVGARELKFFPGVARGSVYPGFRYESLDGAAVVPVSVRDPEGDDWFQCRDYFNGGPLFTLPGRSTDEPEPWQAIEHKYKGIEVLAAYPERNYAAAALRCSFGRGIAVLCGTHPETIPSSLVVDGHTKGKAGELKRLLEEAAEGRRKYWNYVLRAALPEYLCFPSKGANAYAM